MSSADRDSPDSSRDTRASLFVRLRDSKQRSQYEEAWRTFYVKYSGPMFTWCCGKGVRPEDAESLVHDLMLKLMRTLKSYEYDPRRSFRAWLKVVTRNAAIDLVRANSKMILTNGQELGEVLASESVQEQLELAAEREMMWEARRIAEPEYSATETGRRDWEIFRASVDDGESAASLANRFGISRQLVYVVKHRVLTCIKEIAASLDVPRP